ncbi:ubiquitin-conjugating enzyme E2S [Arthroderma uncinatum]|uniref:ubiquitin-conjugating enzyme E2S n=1 Tax=Arthroderma uncinatum TaxID=74035 RepID=UPI00144AD05E|nr:ubiquitin-conjugating enzyme E2S [Arthroderma uncinatum]KAF3480177.1 ubiquitin-conjugating enzyme E2S [Arthroderma uncinatum]
MGLWRLQLRLPEDYPASPPKAFFRTRIWHPNVEESTGAVCVDTLKRDWDSKLTLKDVLVTISCLLIHPNPDSALNSTAGALLQDNYESFARQAKLMTSIHAPIPEDMRDSVNEARRGADEAEQASGEQKGSDTGLSKGLPSSTVTMKRKQPAPGPEEGSNMYPTSTQEQYPLPADPDSDSDAESDAENSASKENDPTLSSSPVIIPARSPRSVLGKRPLSVLSAPEEPDLVLINDSSDDEDGDHHSEFSGMTASEKNVAANVSSPATVVARNRSNSTHFIPSLNDQSLLLQLRRKAPKLSDSGAKRSCINVAPVSIFTKSADKKRVPEGIVVKPLSPIMSATTSMTATATMKDESSLLPSLKQASSGSNKIAPQPSSVAVEGEVSRSMAPALTKRPALSNLTVRPKPRTGLRRL